MGNVHLIIFFPYWVLSKEGNLTKIYILWIFGSLNIFLDKKTECKIFN